MDSPTKRFVYVLIGWEERSSSCGRPAVWRFSLEDTRAEQRVGFGSLDELMAFLEAETGPGGGMEQENRGAEEQRRR